MDWKALSRRCLHFPLFEQRNWKEFLNRCVYPQSFFFECHSNGFKTIVKNYEIAYSWVRIASPAGLIHFEKTPYFPYISPRLPLRFVYSFQRTQYTPIALPYSPTETPSQPLPSISSNSFWLVSFNSNKPTGQLNIQVCMTYWFVSTRWLYNIMEYWHGRWRIHLPGLLIRNSSLHRIDVLHPKLEEQ